MNYIKKKWYGIKTIPGKEKKIKSNIKINIKNYYFKKFIGNLIIPIKGNINYIPGYIFIEVNLNSKLMFIIKHTPGVINFLFKKNNCIPIKIKKKKIKILLYNIKKSTYIIGETVQIIDGPFKNFNGILKKIKKKKIELSILIFNRKTTLKLNLRQIKKIN
ncbi:transcription termination/antitermination NusG family protein [Candidatus Karelsulcia muelleri]|uniref:transcription termination/antitermination NusG family protein n=1 Tax=Candidatus Karelsulcia muelleri TaxID=336810 RepID=UPI0035C8A63C